MAISINQIKSGMGVLIDREVYLVTEHKHVKPGKGAAFLRVKLRNMKTQQVLEKTIKPADKVEEADFIEKKLQYSYNSGNSYHFMDLASYEEVVISKEVLGSAVKFLKDDLEVVGVFHSGRILKVNLPIKVDYKVIQTEPGFKGDSSKAGTKPAKIDTGTTIQVPLFINIDDWIKVDTRTGAYVERVKK